MLFWRGRSEKGVVFSHLKSFDKILVTGPQRSGTRICAKMIAQDTGHHYVDEEHFGFLRKGCFRMMLESCNEIVVQCPALSRWIHEFSGDDTIIVFMKRNPEDVIASQERIGWGYEERELEQYGCKKGRQARVKYDFWKKKQKPVIKHFLEVEYESLSKHPLWVPKENRKNFEWNQTKQSLDRV